MKILIKNISHIAACAARGGYMPLGVMRDPVVPGNSIMIDEGKIAEIGMDIESNADRVIDAQNCLVTPGFTDNHTHLVFSGTRENEFEMRTKGMTYKEIAGQGGGILSSVRMTRSASEDELYCNASKWLDRMIRIGLTSVEIKSGYGLNTETELKQLRVIKRLKEDFPVNVRSTFLGAHEFPEEFRQDRKAYIRLLVEEMIPAVTAEGLADYIDVFCEKGVYSPDETAEILEAGIKHGLKPRLHSDEIDESKGAYIAGKYSAKSSDHMNVPDIKALETLAEKKTVITLLPATNMILRIDKKPPVGKMRELGNIMALSTDFNPGSSPVYSIQTAAGIGVYNYRLTAEEALYGITCNPAFSLDLEQRTGSIEEGKDADIVIHDIENYRQMFYFLGYNSAKTVIVKGRIYE